MIPWRWARHPRSGDGFQGVAVEAKEKFVLLSAEPSTAGNTGAMSYGMIEVRDMQHALIIVAAIGECWPEITANLAARVKP